MWNQKRKNSLSEFVLWILDRGLCLICSAGLLSVFVVFQILVGKGKVGCGDSF